MINNVNEIFERDSWEVSITPMVLIMTAFEFIIPLYGASLIISIVMTSLMLSVFLFVFLLNEGFNK